MDDIEDNDQKDILWADTDMKKLKDEKI